jgi:predicted aminopeptidase
LLKKNKNILLIIWQFALLSILIAFVTDTQLWVYLLRQAKGQLSIVFHTQSVEKAIANNSFSEAQIMKIRLIKEIKVFAEKEFGLKETDNYTSFFDQKGKPILWMLTACEPYSFKEKTWHFPFLGDVSYKGFFDYHLALKEANFLKMQHYDVDIGKVSAWSTLGILSDPILSSMLEDTEGEIAELIIHELTHATLFFPNNVAFNENFASFVGRQGALQFIKYKFSNHSKQMIEYLNGIKEEDKLKQFLFDQKTILELFYADISLNSSIPMKEELKNEEIEKIILSLYDLDVYNWKTKIKIAQKIRISGNAFFMSYNRYDGQYSMLLNEFEQHKSNLKKFIYFYRNQDSID